MRKRDFSENVESESIAFTPINLPFKFEGDPEKFPRRVLGTWLKRCIPTDVPQIGWTIEHADRLWEVTQIRQALQSKGSPNGDRLSVRVCKYIEDLQ
jgi:hypothetical protein